MSKEMNNETKMNERMYQFVTYNNCGCVLDKSGIMVYRDMTNLSAEMSKYVSKQLLCVEDYIKIEYV